MWRVDVATLHVRFQALPRGWIHRLVRVLSSLVRHDTLALLVVEEHPALRLAVRGLPAVEAHVLRRVSLAAALATAFALGLLELREVRRVVYTSVPGRLGANVVDRLLSSVVVLREPRGLQVQVLLQLWVDKVTHQDCRLDGVTVSPFCTSYCFSRSHLKIDSTSTDFGG